jgi:hypothetical protein
VELPQWGHGTDAVESSQHSQNRPEGEGAPGLTAKTGGSNTEVMPAQNDAAPGTGATVRPAPDPPLTAGDILKPKKYGGLELSEHEHAKVAMTLARGCASTAWVFPILSSGNMAILAYPEQASAAAPQVN